jgi:hypothetical protein
MLHKIWRIAGTALLLCALDSSKAFAECRLCIDVGGWCKYVCQSCAPECGFLNCSVTCNGQQSTCTVSGPCSLTGPSGFAADGRAIRSPVVTFAATSKTPYFTAALSAILRPTKQRTCGGAILAESGRADGVNGDVRVGTRLLVV